MENVFVIYYIMLSRFYMWKHIAFIIHKNKLAMGVTSEQRSIFRCNIKKRIKIKRIYIYKLS